jgi:hypothetical protein
MPRSQTPVVSCALAIPRPGLLPSGACKPSAFAAIPRRLSCCPRLYIFRGSITRPASSLTPASHAHCWAGTWSSLLTCWLGVSQVGLEPEGSHPLGNNNQFHRISPTPKVSGLPWREQAIVRGFGGCAASHVEGTGGAPGALCYPALDTVGRRDRPRIGAVCPFVRLVSGVSEHIIGDRPRPDPVWETARFSVPPASHGCPSSVSCDWRLP